MTAESLSFPGGHFLCVCLFNSDRAFNSAGHFLVLKKSLSSLTPLNPLGK